MALKTSYKIITGNETQIHRELAAATADGWKPILLSTVHAVVTPTGQGHIVTTIILEHAAG